VLFLNTADDGKHVSIKVGREIVITLQTIDPEQYGTPQILSSSIRFKGSYFPREQKETTRPAHQLLMTSTVLIRYIRLLLGYESRPKSQERRLRRIGDPETPLTTTD